MRPMTYKICNGCSIIVMVVVGCGSRSSMNVGPLISSYMVWIDSCHIIIVCKLPTIGDLTITIIEHPL